MTPTTSQKISLIRLWDIARKGDEHGVATEAESRELLDALGKLDAGEPEGGEVERVARAMELATSLPMGQCVFLAKVAIRTIRPRDDRAVAMARELLGWISRDVIYRDGGMLTELQRMREAREKARELVELLEKT